MKRLKFRDISKDKIVLPEEVIQEQLNKFLLLRYPHLIFKFDPLANIKLTIGQATKAKRLGHRKGWPDLFIAQPNYLFHGLFIELKKDGTILYKKNGEWATPHLEDQAKVLEHLRSKGYKAEFAIGFQEAKTIISQYLSNIF
jgi:hypothetical protein